MVIYNLFWHLKLLRKEMKILSFESSSAVAASVKRKRKKKKSIFLHNSLDDYINKISSKAMIMLLYSCSVYESNWEDIVALCDTQPEANRKGPSSSFSCSTRSPQFCLSSMNVFDSINFQISLFRLAYFFVCLPYGIDIKHNMKGNF